MRWIECSGRNGGKSDVRPEWTTTSWLSMTSLTLIGVKYKAIVQIVGQIHWFRVDLVSYAVCIDS